MQTINIGWFKRDLRLSDHGRLCAAQMAAKPVLLLYIVEPMLLDGGHYDLRHWQLPAMEEQLYEFSIGKDYPAPIVNITESGKRARQLLWSWRNRPAVTSEAERIIAQHVRPGSRRLA